ncbi:MAG: lysophospholipid acyltransferase family protein [Myxococcota bacterium]|nr:lysophospholipid acyltransferase family protein [Myxococcota bacterium]
MAYALRYLLVALYTVFWGMVGIAVGIAGGSRKAAGIQWVGRSWMHWILVSCGVRVESEGLEGVTRPCILMSNHQSVFDIAAIVETFPYDWRFVAKRELLHVPFFGWALAVADQIIIDRSNRAEAVKSLRLAAQRIRGGENVIVFPEGTRSADALLHDFKSGGFHLAIEAGVPVIPVTVSGSQRITPKRSLRIESGRVLVRYGKPIETSGLRIEDRNELKRIVREAILGGYEPELQPGRGLA